MSTEHSSATVDDADALAGLRSFYRIGDEIALRRLPSGTERLRATRSTGDSVEVASDKEAHLGGVGRGTWRVQALAGDGSVLAEDITTVAEHAGDLAVHGFATSFQDDDVVPLLKWQRALRSTVVQVYDWMESYTEPAGPESGWRDPGGRPVSSRALSGLARGLREDGAIAHAYAPIYAVGHAFAEAHPEMLMYRADRSPIPFMDQIILANPANASWQKHFAQAYGSAADRIGFGGFHVDTYGYPRLAYDAAGHEIDVRAAYEAFLVNLRRERPAEVISFNQVNGVPAVTQLPSNPSFRYCEVWAPNEQWRHFEGLLARSSGRGAIGATGTESLRGSIACYPRVWGRDEPARVAPVDRQAALRTVVRTEAVATMLGASALLYGDSQSVLWDAYYPKNEVLSDGEAADVLRWHRFALRSRDLFLAGEDTSWQEIGDDNNAVAVETSLAPVRPEPLGGTVFARVVHGDGLITVGVLDLTGSESGRWSDPTGPSGVDRVTVRVHVGDPERWRVEVATLGVARSEFLPVAAREVSHRWGRGLEFELPLNGGWAVARLLA